MFRNRKFSSLAAAVLASVSLGAAPRVRPAAHPHVPLAAPLVRSAPVVTYHNDYYRSGQYVMPGLTLAAAAHLHRDRAFSGAVDGSVYAQPLFWSAPGLPGGEVIVATETNHVTALDAARGNVLWDRVLGAPVQGGVLPCGNIAPEGVTGTPAIDPATGTLYVAATAMAGRRPVPLVFGLSLKTGRILPGWPVDVASALRHVGFNAAWQGQRGALAFDGGRLFVPYGGRYGDCDNYHGSVVSLATAHPTVTGIWRTRAVRGGIWSAGGIAMADGSLFASTGNTSGASAWSGGEAIVRLSTALAMEGYFAPANWQQLDDADEDLGGTNPMPLDVAGRKLVVALGKDGNAYLADRTNLGGIGGQLAVQQVSSGEIIGGPASWPDAGAAFVAFQGYGTASKCASRNGLTVLRITGGSAPALTTAWCASFSGAGDPIVTTTDGSSNRIVWAAGAESDGRLHGYAASNGAVVFAGGGSGDAMQNLRHMSTVLAAGGRLYVPADGRIYAFALR